MTSDWSPDELELIDRYLAGVATPSEGARAAELFARDPESARRYQVAIETLSRDDVLWPDGQEMWGRLRDRISVLDTQEIVKVGHQHSIDRLGLWKSGKSGRQTFRRGLWLGVAAVAVVGVIMMKQRALSSRGGVTRTYATSASQQAIISLDDGSRMTLAPGTTVRLQHFGVQSRTVILDGGEAYFEVVHTSGLPFIVRSGTATAQALGTAFLVRHRAGDAHVRVAVADGKVRVTTSQRTVLHNGSGVTLTAGQVGDLTDSTAQVSTADDLAPGTEWESGRIMFRHTPLATVLRTVTQWYGYQFRYADSTLRTRNVTISVSTRSSAEALARIERVLAVNIVVTGDTVTLVPRPLQTMHGTPRARNYDVWTPTTEVGR